MHYSILQLNDLSSSQTSVPVGSTAQPFTSPVGRALPPECFSSRQTNVVMRDAPGRHARMASSHLPTLIGGSKKKWHRWAATATK